MITKVLWCEPHFYENEEQDFIDNSKEVLYRKSEYLKQYRVTKIHHDGKFHYFEFEEDISESIPK